MKVILTGKNSYIGNKTCELLKSFGHEAQCISVRNGIDGLDLKGVDAVVHCAAIVHNNKENVSKFYRVNYELTSELAELAMDSGVKHFVYLSTMAVYGDEAGEISKTTAVKPSTPYSKSKHKAEKAIMRLSSEEFKVCVLRPPMVYGEGCPGNYARLRKFAKWSFVVPDTQNVKSLLYVGNLANFICEVIEEGFKGIFNIMDGDYSSTADLVTLIGEANGKKIFKSGLLGKVLKLFLKVPTVRKAFGTLYYDETTAVKLDYYSQREAIYLTEGNKDYEEKTLQTESANTDANENEDTAE